MMIKAVILANELKEDHLPWIIACEQYKDIIDFRVVNLVSYNWYEEVCSHEFDILLAKPGGLTSSFKLLYDERIFNLGVTKSFTVFPSPAEIFLYENKRFLSYWLKANKIPHPKTDVFYDKKEAILMLEDYKFPLVGKTSIGASGSGVRIMNNRSELKDYISDCFNHRGAERRTGPDFKKKDLIKRGLSYILRPGNIRKKLKIYRLKRDDRQSDHIILQEFISHDFEWRVVRIGDSFFAHKKLKIRNKASGSLVKLYDNPPFELLDFVRIITEKYGFYSQAIDLFETPDGYLVNEMQCIFGQSDPFQMKVDNVPGRYLYRDGKWIFEAGDFNQNQSYNLRVEWVIKMIR